MHTQSVCESGPLCISKCTWHKKAETWPLHHNIHSICISIRGSHVVNDDDENERTEQPNSHAYAQLDAIDCCLHVSAGARQSTYQPLSAPCAIEQRPCLCQSAPFMLHSSMHLELPPTIISNAGCHVCIWIDDGWISRSEHTHMQIWLCRCDYIIIHFRITIRIFEHFMEPFSLLRRLSIGITIKSLLANWMCT